MTTSLTDFEEWMMRELPRATGYEIDLCHTVWIGAHQAIEKKLDESLQIGVLFGNYNEPLDAYGKRLLRAILVEIDPLIQETRKGNKSALLVGGE